MKVFFIALLAWALFASTASATSAERDSRRAEYLTGFSCHLNNRGHAWVLTLRERGIGELRHSTIDVDVRWKVENDEFCMSFNHGEMQCHKLPSRDMPNEKEWLIEGLQRKCT